MVLAERTLQVDLLEVVETRVAGKGDVGVARRLSVPDEVGGVELRVDARGV